MTSVSIGRRPSPINLTDAAAAKVADLLAQEGNAELALRVAVRPGGCSGFSYEMFFDSDTGADDVVRELSGVKVVGEPERAQVLTGWGLGDQDGLQGAGC